MANIKEWSWYQNGINYNNSLSPSFYDLVDCNWDFFYGFQWRNANLSGDYPQPVFNNINRFATFFVASIMANKPTLKFQSPVTSAEDKASDKILNESWEEFVERVKLVWQSKNAMYDGVVTGDYVGHMIMNPDAKPYDGTLSDIEGQIEFELIDPNNFYMGNANSKDVQGQPYIQIAGRDMIKNLNDEREAIKKMNDSEEVLSDNNTEEQASEYGKIEMEEIESDDGNINGKATYVITYTKKKSTEEIEVIGENGEVVLDQNNEPITKKSERKTVHASKCVDGTYIYEDVDMGIELYPVALGNWELQRNTYHGMSFVQSAIPAQIFINRGFAMAMKNTIDTAFSKFFYDKGSITGTTNKVASQTGVTLKPGQRLSDVAMFLQPGNMSAQVMQMIEMANTYMKETIGANDALLGNVNPEQASGVSIAVSSKQSGIPLENPKSNLYNWWEDLGRIYKDMVSNLYGTRPVLVTEGEETVVQDYNFDELKGFYKVPVIEVGASGYWSELAAIDTLNNLLDRQLIEFIDYLERMPEGYIADKAGLINKINEQIQGQEEVAITQQEYLSQLSEEDRAKFESLPPEKQQQLFEQFEIEQNISGQTQAAV